ncbi:MAG: LuxR C-terminal-related transcriptional regulator [Bosea sp. (in: a-proteobacteria)]
MLVSKNGPLGPFRFFCFVHFVILTWLSSMSQSIAPPLIISADDVVATSGRMGVATSVAALRDLLSVSLAPFGFMGFTFAAIRRVKSVFLHAEIVSTWPRKLQTTFQQHELFNVDPVILRSRACAEPFVWDLSIYERGNAIHEQLVALRVSIGVTGGICIPVSEAFQGRSVLYLSGDNFSCSPQMILALQLLAEHFAARIYSLGGSEERGGKQTSFNLESGELSPRERQVFGWIAFGKSSREIAMILEISEHTVNDYIASGVAKLNASNRTEAVLRALLTNQIDLS